MKQIYGVVYKMTNVKNGKVYIGQTTRRLKERLWDHVKHAHRNDVTHTRLDNDINIFGKEFFKMEKIEDCFTREELLTTEKYFIIKYKKQLGIDCYNNRLGYKHCQDTKDKISLSKKGSIPWNKGKECEQLQGPNNGMFGKRGLQKTSKEVVMIDKDNKETIFNSVGEAVDYLKSIGFEKVNGSPLSAVCRGVRKSYLGFKWKYNGDY